MELELFFRHRKTNAIRRRNAILPTTPPTMATTGKPLPEELLIVEVKGGVCAAPVGAEVEADIV